MVLTGCVGDRGGLGRWRRLLALAGGVVAGVLMAAPVAQAGVWRLQGAEEFRSPPYNRAGSGRLADADPYCRGHVVEIGGGRDNQSFLVRNLIPGDCHNRNGARGVEEINHQWTAPPATLVPGQPVPLRLRSAVSVLQNIGNGRTESLLIAGFVDFANRNEYGEAGGGIPERHLRVAESVVAGAAGATAADDAQRPGQRAEPLRVPAAPWLGSEQHQGQVRLRLITGHGSGAWASVDYIYRWDGAGTAGTGVTPSPGPVVGGAPTGTPTGTPAGTSTGTGPGTGAPTGTSPGTPVPAPAGAGVNLGQVWTESENGWSGTWTRRGSSNTFDAVWTKDGARVTSVLTITAVGVRGVHIHRRDGDGTVIEYAGLADAQGQVQGVGLVLGSDWRYVWSATIQRTGARRP